MAGCCSGGQKFRPLLEPGEAPRSYRTAYLYGVLGVTFILLGVVFAALPHAVPLAIPYHLHLLPVFRHKSPPAPAAPFLRVHDVTGDPRMAIVQQHVCLINQLAADSMLNVGRYLARVNLAVCQPHKPYAQRPIPEHVFVWVSASRGIGVADEMRVQYWVRPAPLLGNANVLGELIVHADASSREDKDDDDDDDDGGADGDAYERDGGSSELWSLRVASRASSQLAPPTSGLEVRTHRVDGLVRTQIKHGSASDATQALRGVVCALDQFRGSTFLDTDRDATSIHWYGEHAHLQTGSIGECYDRTAWHVDAAWWSLVDADEADSVSTLDLVDARRTSIELDLAADGRLWSAAPATLADRTPVLCANRTCAAAAASAATPDLSWHLQRAAGTLVRARLTSLTYTQVAYAQLRYYNASSNTWDVLQVRRDPGPGQPFTLHHVASLQQPDVASSTVLLHRRAVADADTPWPVPRAATSASGFIDLHCDELGGRVWFRPPSGEPGDPGEFLYPDGLMRVPEAELPPQLHLWCVHSCAKPRRMTARDAYTGDAAASFFPAAAGPVPYTLAARTRALLHAGVDAVTGGRVHTSHGRFGGVLRDLYTAGPLVPASGRGGAPVASMAAGMQVYLWRVDLSPSPHGIVPGDAWLQPTPHWLQEPAPEAVAADVAAGADYSSNWASSSLAATAVGARAVLQHWQDGVVTGLPRVALTQLPDSHPGRVTATPLAWVPQSVRRRVQYGWQFLHAIPGIGHDRLACFNNQVVGAACERVEHMPGHWRPDDADALPSHWRTHVPSRKTERVAVVAGAVTSHGRALQREGPLGRLARGGRPW